jgi:enterochelin esterase-like enzyme
MKLATDETRIEHGSKNQFAFVRVQSVFHPWLISFFKLRRFRNPRDRMSITLFRACLACCLVLLLQSSAANGQEPKERKAIKVDAKIYDACVGQYEMNPKMTLTLFREKQHFMAQLTGQPPFEVFAESESTYFWKIVNAQFTIQKDKDGKVEGVLFEQGAAKFVAKRISTELPKAEELPEPPDVIDSPRLAALAKELKNGNRAAIEKFWDEMKDKAPLVEPTAPSAHTSWVTFLWRGDDRTRRVRLAGGLPTAEDSKWLTRLADTDLWYRTERMPSDSRFVYSFQINFPEKKLKDGDLASLLKVMEKCPTRLDPLNPRDVTLQASMLTSLAELPEAPPQPWLAPLPDVAKGALKEQKLKSESLKGERSFTVYTPANYDPKGVECGLLVIFDGGFYQDQDMIPGPTILDNLIAKKKIPPLVAIFVKHPPIARNKDLACSKQFAEFLVKDLVPWVRANYRVSSDPARTIVGGLSLGGLMASYCGLNHSDFFGNVLSQSGSYQWYPGMLDNPPAANGEPGELTRLFASAPRLPVQFYLEAGRFEDSFPESLLAENRHLRDVLRAKGYTVHYSEYSGGHDYVTWRGTFANALMTLTAPQTNSK